MDALCDQLHFSGLIVRAALMCESLSLTIEGSK